MGEEIDRSYFSETDFARFEAALEAETALLGAWFASGELSCREATGGFELEAWLVDRQARPSANNVSFLEALDNPLVVPELARFNVELNGTPASLYGDALRRMQTELYATWQTCSEVAQALDNDLVMTGILPTLRDEDLTLGNMSKMTRYQALNEQVMRLRRGRPLRLDINGHEHLLSTHHDVMLEAAATSFQVHTQVPFREAVRYYNAAMVSSAPLVAVSNNSPFLFGSDLWAETRIPLFEQAVELGGLPGMDFGPMKRVSFGSGYAHDSIMECFIENREHFPILLPVEYSSPADELKHLRLHNGTIWRWNRPLVGFDADGTPHIRIEHRVIPAGPTIIDAFANTALYFGLQQAFMNRTTPIEHEIEFAQARDNFYAAARHGLEARVHWQGRHVPVKALLLDELLPMARSGLVSLAIDPDDIHDYLGIIEARVRSGQTGSVWQRQHAQRLNGDMRAMTADYLSWQQRGLPVHEWEH
ncbi:glutamate--cysteine ligase [Sulfuriflexus sp.]|uniref:glutamate--cysteine ligase n=1 Tax=Sulfuriflexus sp. TaxID=2015443 RepID=UPI0028CEA7FB|nr:glutamate--cysteine ligase [Sulfuriflexus sp.]MDT8403328.1 glutamate--cysteine ligase [Sulfuriflexus sp.]